MREHASSEADYSAAAGRIASERARTGRCVCSGSCASVPARSIFGASDVVRGGIACGGVLGGAGCAEDSPGAGDGADVGVEAGAVAPGAAPEAGGSAGDDGAAGTGGDTAVARFGA